MLEERFSQYLELDLRVNQCCYVVLFSSILQLLSSSQYAVTPCVCRCVSYGRFPNKFELTRRLCTRKQTKRLNVDRHVQVTSVGSEIKRRRWRRRDLCNTAIVRWIWPRLRNTCLFGMWFVNKWSGLSVSAWIMWKFLSLKRLSLRKLCSVAQSSAGYKQIEEIITYRCRTNYSFQSQTAPQNMNIFCLFKSLGQTCRIVLNYKDVSRNMHLNLRITGQTWHKYEFIRK